MGITESLEGIAFLEDTMTLTQTVNKVTQVVLEEEKTWLVCVQCDELINISHKYIPSRDLTLYTT